SAGVEWDRHSGLALRPEGDRNGSAGNGSAGRRVPRPGTATGAIGIVTDGTSAAAPSSGLRLVIRGGTTATLTGAGLGTAWSGCTPAILIRTIDDEASRVTSKARR